MSGERALRPKPPELPCPEASKCHNVKPAHLSIEYPQSDFYPLHPPNYSCGFSRDGRIIGSNLEVPYPRDLPWYHDIPFRRSVDWFAPAIVGEDEHEVWNFIRKKEEKREGGHIDGCKYCRVEETSAQTKTGLGDKKCCGRQRKKSCVKPEQEEKQESNEDDEDKLAPLDSCVKSPYPASYLVENDPDYKAWVDGKLDAQRARDAAQEELVKVPWEIKLYPGHCAPSILQTTNETYGNHLDMLPKPPLVYPEVEIEHKIRPLLVRYQRSNMSDHPLIPDHSFAIDSSELESLDGKPLRGTHGALFKPDQTEAHQTKLNDEENLKLPELKNSKNKIQTKTESGSLTTVVSGPGVRNNTAGQNAKDPWTFRRSVVMLGKVIGERQPGCTWPIYTPTGLELNRPIPKLVAMTSGYPGSDKKPTDVKVPINTKDGIYNIDTSRLTEKACRTDCAPNDVKYDGFSTKHPCHRDFFYRDRLPMPIADRKDILCDQGQKKPLLYKRRK
ncbi:hypothetical protein PoB_002752300 [Plakobranchus ocellatus]|uniref:Uncharacterized protein n=1 Tax=Plakobranchus ocellatus TaxID=259542 RepID=A0AAV4A2Y6_9GAST|nr:hypothetical protein PoB_002752300 [Plakobranchus ocellatus]